MAFTIQFDYRYDTAGFFDNADARAALEAAADLWEEVIEDEFKDVPAGVSLDIRNPTTGDTETVVLDSAIDDILIFVGATNFSGGTLAIAGPDGVNAAGDTYASRISSDFRGNGPVTDFEPWAGTITFDSDTDWHFGPGAPAPTEIDFVTVAGHEIGHVLGIGIAAAFDRWIINDVFTGPNTTQLNGGAGVPVEDDHAHVLDGFADDAVLLDPTITRGNQLGLSDFDKAILADIGYEIAGFEQQGSQPEIVTEEAELIFGTDVADVIHALGGNDTIQGGGGDDILRGGSGNDFFFGQDGRDTFVIAAGDNRNTISDFDSSSEVIRLLDSGFTTAAEAVAAITKPAGNISRLTFEDGTRIDIFHSTQSGTPLTAANFEVAGDLPVTPDVPDIPDVPEVPDTPSTPDVPLPPENAAPTGNVSVIGTERVGETLTANTNTIADADGLGAFSFIWFREDAVIPSATDPTYTLTASDESFEIRVRVTYTDGLGNSETLASQPTGAIAANVPEPTVPETPTNGSDDMNGDETDNVITGTSADDILSGDAGNDTLSGGPGNDILTGGVGFDTFVISPGDEQVQITDFTYFSDKLDLSAFQRADVALALFNVQGDDRATLRFSDGTELTVFGDGVNAGNFDLAEIFASGSNQGPQGSIEVSGEFALGATLTADISGVTDVDVILPDSVTLTWLRNGQVINGATDETYTITEEDLDAVLTVRLNYFDVFGVFESLTSAGISADGSEEPGDGGAPGDGGMPGDGEVPDDGGDTPDGGDSEPPVDIPTNGDGVNDTPARATPFNDVFTARAGLDTIDGGDGVDTVVFGGDQGNYTLTIGPDQISISDRRPDGIGNIELESIERLNFEFGALTSDGPLDLTQFNGHGALTAEEFETFIEVYIAYFNRAPDALGLAFWATSFANGTSLEEIASLFLEQEETQDIYPEGTPNIVFASEVYSNVLGRTPDLEGLQFWRSALDSGAVSRDQFILEVLRGVDAGAGEDASEAFIQQQQADQLYLAQKTDLGALYAVHRGLSDVQEAAEIFALFDGTSDGLDAALVAVEDAFAEASSIENGEFLLPLVGVLDSPL